MSAWSAGTPGILPLPPGRLVRGRGLRRPLPDGTLPEFGVYLLNKRPEPVSWDARWVRWPDFRLPTDRRDAQDALYEAWRRAANERVEFACGGVAAGPAPHSPAWRCWTECPVARRSPTCASITTREPRRSRRPDRDAPRAPMALNRSVGQRRRGSGNPRLV